MTAPVLIAGGYGVVGAQVARLLRDRHPGLPLLLGGRTPATGRGLAADLGDAEAVALDLAGPGDPLAGLPAHIAAIVSTVNDLDDRLLDAAIARGIPLVDVTRWTSLVHRSLARCATQPLRAPVLLASGWMAGVAPLLVAWAARDLGPVREVDIAIRYALADRAGPDSVAYMDRFAERFETTVDGRQVLVTGLSDGRDATFADGSHGPVYRLDTPEQLTLPITIGARTVATRIGFDSAATTRLLVLLRKKLEGKPVPAGELAGLLRAPSRWFCRRFSLTRPITIRQG